MTSRSDIEAGKAFLRLFLKDDMTKDLKKSLGEVGKTLKETGATVMKIGAGITAAGAAITGALTFAVKHFMKVGDDLGDMAARTNVAASALAELSYAATLSGTDLGAVEKSLIRMQRTLGDAIGKSKTARKAFDDIGLSWKNLQQMAPEDQFQEIADAIGRFDENEQLSKATDIFGKGAAEILPMLKNLRELREEARKEGLIPSEEAIKAASLLDDSFNKLKASISSLVFEIGASLVDEVLAFAEMARKAIKTVREFIRENAGLVKVAAAVGIALTALGGIITGIGGAMFGVGVALIALKAVIAGLVATFAFLISPIGLTVMGIAAVTAALIGTVAAWAKFSDSGKKACKEAKSALDAILASLTSGQWKLAGEIAMAQLNLAWVIGTTGLKLLWSDTVFAIQNLWDDAMTSLADSFYALVDQIRAAWKVMFPTMPMGVVGQARADAADKATKRAADRKAKKDDSDLVHAKAIFAALKKIDDLMARAKGLGGAPGFGADVRGFGMAAGKGNFDDALKDQRKNMITTSAAAAVAAGYQGGIYKMDQKEKDLERAIKKHLEEAEKDRKKMLRDIEKIAEGLVYR